jgi:serine/threonine protein kinase
VSCACQVPKTFFSCIHATKRCYSADFRRNFAAPELVENVRNKDDPEDALTECVSNYGLIGDAYSIGATLSEIVTGVPPGQDIKTYVKANRKVPKPQSKFSKLSKVVCGGHKGPYDMQLRLFSELPKPCSNLITSLMDNNPITRSSVREAQEHEWIGGYDTLEHGDVDSRSGSKCIPLQNIAAFN